MTPLLARKLGEVQAFAVIGGELLERGGTTALAAFGQTMIDELTTAFSQQTSRISELADPEKTAKTITKLRGMMDTYIGENWDNPIELLEWSGFYLGAAGIHWSLVSGAGSASDGLNEFADEQAKQFSSWLQTAYDRIKVQIAAR